MHFDLNPILTESILSKDFLMALGLLVALVVMGFVGIVYDVLFVKSLTSGSSSKPPESKTNCTACGARNSKERDRCEYCDEPLRAGE